MARLQERYRHWDERRGLVTVGRVPIAQARHAVERSLPTMQRAREVFDRTLALLAGRAYLDPAGGTAHRVVHARDPRLADWLVAQPLLHLALSPTSHTVLTFTIADPILPEDAPEGWRFGDPWYRAEDPDPAIYPRGPHMCAGELTIAEGPAFFTVTYDERGLRKETRESATDAFVVTRYGHARPYTIDPTARPPGLQPIALLCRADLDPRGHALDELADNIAELAPWERSLGRVQTPAPVPGGVVEAWRRGLFALRPALYRGQVPDGARFAIADALDGRAVASGPTVERALAAWHAEIFRSKPAPPRPIGTPPAPVPEPFRSPEVHRDESEEVIALSTGTLELRGTGYGGDIPWPAAVPARMPRVLVELPPLPEPPRALREHGFERWTRVIGAHGAVGHALVRPERDGATLLGEGILDLVDPRTLDTELDAADAEQSAMFDAAPGMPNPMCAEGARASIRYYGCWDAGRQRRAAFSSAGVHFGAELDLRNLDGDRARWTVTRLRQA